MKKHKTLVYFFIHVKEANVHIIVKESSILPIFQYFYL